jgi:fumarate reductase subunit D
VTVFLPVIASVVGLVLVQRLVPSSLREEHNDVAGFIYAVVGIMYAVLLAFVVIVVWQNYERAKDTVESEANELAGIYFLADRLPDPERTHIQGLTRSYARIVVEEEWPLMERGESSARATAVLRDLRLSLQNIDADTSAGLVLYDQALTRMHELSDARRLRLLETTEGLPGILWVVLVGGGVITVCFTYLFGLKNNVAHLLMVAALTLLVCGILFTIGTLDYPFSGVSKLQPNAFEEVLRSFDES